MLGLSLSALACRQLAGSKSLQQSTCIAQVMHFDAGLDGQHACMLHV